MKQPNPTCGNCKHFDSYSLDIFPRMRKGSGECMAKMPMCVMDADHVNANDDAENGRCPCYEPNPLTASIGRNEPVDVSEPEVETCSMCEHYTLPKSGQVVGSCTALMFYATLRGSIPTPSNNPVGNCPQFVKAVDK